MNETALLWQENQELNRIETALWNWHTQTHGRHSEHLLPIGADPAGPGISWEISVEHLAGLAELPVDAVRAIGEHDLHALQWRTNWGSRLYFTGLAFGLRPEQPKVFKLVFVTDGVQVSETRVFDSEADVQAYVDTHPGQPLYWGEDKLA